MAGALSGSVASFRCGTGSRRWRSDSHRGGTWRTSTRTPLDSVATFEIRDPAERRGMENERSSDSSTGAPASLGSDAAPRPATQRRPLTGKPSQVSIRKAARRRLHPTRIEGALGGILNGLHLRYLREYWIGHYWVDFVLVDFFLVIEADGRLFHGDTHREDNRDAELKRHGWDVMHVFGPNIVNERKLVAESIKQDVRRARRRPPKSGEPPRRDVIAEWDAPKPKPASRKKRLRYHHHSVFDEPV
jgi:very-short-patch-repair endonuclease